MLTWVLAVGLAAALGALLASRLRVSELEADNARLRRWLGHSLEQVRTFKGVVNGLCSCAEDIIQRRA